MPIIPKCEKCGRKDGYATDKDSKVCARCEQSNGDTDATDDDQT